MAEGSLNNELEIISKQALAWRDLKIHERPHSSRPQAEI
jgi:hypothetical protein